MLSASHQQLLAIALFLSTVLLTTLLSYLSKDLNLLRSNSTPCSYDPRNLEIFLLHLTSQVNKLTNTPATPPYAQPACFYSAYYEAAVLKFLTLAQQTNAEIYNLPVLDDKLANQVAVFRGHSQRFLIHISGTHGVEAHAGSAVQIAILADIIQRQLYSNQTNELPTLILVHGLNPFGFKYHRRVNEDNIDLNRNFLTDEEFRKFQQRDPNYAGYVDLDSVLNPVSHPTPYLIINQVIHLLHTIRGMLSFGMGAIKRAMVSGNYHKSSGLGFGGFRRARSTDNLINLLKDTLHLPELATKMALIDVHSGLGPTGVDTLLISADRDVSQLFSVEKDSSTGLVTGGLLVPFQSPGSTPVSSPVEVQKETEKTSHHDQSEASKVASGYELTRGTVSADLISSFLQRKDGEEPIETVSVTQEFGTVPTMLVGNFLIEENYAYHYGSEEEKSWFSSMLLRCFYVDQDKWKLSILRRGMTLYREMVQYLQK